MKRYAFPLTIILLLFAVIAMAAPGDKRPAVTSAAIGLGTSSSATMGSVTATTSVTAPAFNSSAADGYHYILPYNSISFAGTPLVGMIQTTPTGPQWYTGSAWEAIGSGGGGTWGSITGTLSAQTDLQAALDAITAGGITISTGTPSTPGAAYLNDSTHVLTVASATGYTQFTGSFTAWDTTPDAFAFTDETDVAADGGQSCGAAITVTGTNYPTTISATGDTGAGYKLNGGTFTSASGTYAPNDTVAPCVNRSSSNSTATTATITIGGVPDAYSVTTAAGSSSLCSGGYSFCSGWEEGSNALNTGATTESVWSSVVGSPTRTTGSFESTYILSTSGNDMYVVKDFTTNQNYMETRLAFKTANASLGPASYQRILRFGLDAGGNYETASIYLSSPSGTPVVRAAAKTDGSNFIQMGTDQAITANTWYQVKLWWEKNVKSGWTLYSADGTQLYTSGDVANTYNYGTRWVAVGAVSSSDDPHDIDAVRMSTTAGGTGTWP